MNMYELMVIFSPQMMSDSGTTPKVVLEKLIKKLKIEVADEDDWGEKSMEYMIDGYDRGYYVVYQLRLEDEQAEELLKKIRHEKGVLRWLLTKIDA